MVDINNLLQRADNLMVHANEIEKEHDKRVGTKESLEKTIEDLKKTNTLTSEKLKVATEALAILGKQSDSMVDKSYKFIESNLNMALAKIFQGKTRSIKLREGLMRGTPTLEFDLIENGGIVRSLKSDSGHGVEQVVSLLSILCLICINGGRRFMVLDEVMSGMDADTRRVINDILWSFTTIGFQFLISEHGFIPEGAYVHVLQNDGTASYVKRRFINNKGVYLDGKSIKDVGKELVDAEEDVEEATVQPMANKVLAI